MTQSESDSKASGIDRRNVLAGLGVMAGFGLAGCLGDGDDDDGTVDDAAVDAEPGEVVQVRARTHTRGGVDELNRIVYENWADELGFELDFDIMDDDTFSGTTWGEGRIPDDAHVSWYGWGASPLRIVPDFFLSQMTEGGTQNITGYQSDEFDALFDEFSQTIDIEERNQMAAELAEIIAEDVPQLTIYHQEAIYPLNTDLWDIQPAQWVGIDLGNIMGILDATPQADVTDLVVATTLDYRSANPLTTTQGNIHEMLNMVYDPLGIGNYEGGIDLWALEDFEQTGDTTLELTLRDDLTFHDGTPATAEDLAFSLNFYSRNTLPVIPEQDNIDEATVEGDYTVSVDFHNPPATFIPSDSIFLKLLPEHIWADAEEEVDDIVDYVMDTEDIIGSGPLEVVEMEQTRMEFVNNPDHDHFRKPEWDRFIHIFREDFEAIRADLVAENVHFAAGPLPVGSVIDLAEEEDHISIDPAPSIDLRQYAFDLERGPFSDKVMRQALKYATDTEVIQDVVYVGTGTPGNGTVMHPEHEFMQGVLPTIDELYDPEHARSMLEDAGYTWDDDGRLRYPED